jgi:hypothetical protein
MSNTLLTLIEIIIPTLLGSNSSLSQEVGKEHEQRSAEAVLATGAMAEVYEEGVLGRTG